MEFDSSFERHLFYDSFMIELVVRNLISNAIKFTKENGKILIGTIDADSNLVFYIEDNGVGIREEEIERILKRASTLCDNFSDTIEFSKKMRTFKETKNQRLTKNYPIFLENLETYYSYLSSSLGCDQ